ncbi:hypothetical protein CYMTET_20550 [Cymbomonas tetramitiformis]|uniref:Uncharacterized protein n=1 Tax=Cymbomonas tetramitiformis TaxID=36881 RepID=A0AAE0L424_9CHLO|nr:hypothetical protein CYMTET_20550 [Cymbomonas tetramitiformis]
MRNEESGQEGASPSTRGGELAEQIRSCRASQWEQGLANFQDLQRLGIIPDSETYIATVELLLRAHKHRAALTVLKNMMTECPLFVEDKHFWSVLSVCLRSSDWKDTMKTLDMLLNYKKYRLYRKLTERVLRHYTLNNSRTALLLTFQKLDFSIYQLSEREFSYIMLVCSDTLLHQSSLTPVMALAQLQSAGHTLNSSHCHATIVAFVRAKREDAAAELFHALMRDPQIEFTGEQCIFLQRCCESQGGSESLKYKLHSTYRQLRVKISATDLASKKSTSANSQSCKMVEDSLVSFKRAGRWESLVALVEPVLEECHQGDNLLQHLPTSAYQGLVVAFCELEKYAEVLRVFEQLWHQLPSCLDAEAWRAIIYSCKMSNCRDVWPMLAERLRLSLASDTLKGPYVEILCCELLLGLGRHQYVGEAIAFFRALHADEVQQECGLRVYCSMVEVLWCHALVKEAILCVTEGIAEGTLDSILPVEVDEGVDSFLLRLGPLSPRTTCAVVLLWLSQLYNMSLDDKYFKPHAFLAINTILLALPSIEKGERLMISTKPSADVDILGEMLTQLGFSFEQTDGYVITWDSFESSRPITMAASDRDNPWALHITAEALSQRLSSSSSADLSQSSLSQYSVGASQTQSSQQRSRGAVVPADPSAPVSAQSQPLLTPDPCRPLGGARPQRPSQGAPLLPPPKRTAYKAFDVNQSTGRISHPYGGPAPLASSAHPFPPGLLRGSGHPSMEKTVLSRGGTHARSESAASARQTAITSEQAATTGGGSSSCGREVALTGRDTTVVDEQVASLGNTAGSTGRDATLAGGGAVSAIEEAVKTDRQTVPTNKTAAQLAGATKTNRNKAAMPSREATLPVLNLQTRTKGKTQSESAGEIGLTSNPFRAQSQLDENRSQHDNDELELLELYAR